MIIFLRNMDISLKRILMLSLICINVYKLQTLEIDMNIYYDHGCGGGDSSRRYYSIKECARDLVVGREINPEEMTEVPIPEAFKVLGVRSGMICCPNGNTQEGLEKMMRYALKRITELESSGELGRQLEQSKLETEKLRKQLGF